MAAIDTTQSANSFWSRLLSALPDAATAGGCLIVWIAPRALGDGAVKAVLLMLLMEFILIHATGFFTAIACSDDLQRILRIAMLLGLALFYLLFVGLFVHLFQAWWPVTVLLWLLVGKLAWVFANPRVRDDEAMRQMLTWAFSVVAYMGAIVAGAKLSLPRLGLDAATVASLHLPSIGEWIDGHPHMAIASAVFYYAALALFKAWGGPFRQARFDDA